MGHLLDRLKDPARAGVYRAARAHEILDATAGSGLQVVRIRLESAVDKRGLLERVAHALEFPQWFGGNWDALEDCLTDLSWTNAEGWVLLIEDAGQLPPDDLGVFSDILGAAAAWWSERGRPFFAVFVAGASSLPALFRDKQ